MGLTLLFAAVLLIGSHYYIYRSVVYAFEVTQPRVRFALILGFTALATSIPLAMALHRLIGNAITSTHENCSQKST